MRIGWVLLAAALLCRAQEPNEIKLTNEQLAADAQAEVFFKQHNMVDALPLFEKLAAEVPQSMIYAERLAVCLMGKAGALPDGDEKEAIRKRTKLEAERAKSLGDDSNMLHIVLEWANGQSQTDSNIKMRAAEAAFAKGDLEGALAQYKDLAADEPKNYEARLFAGDMYFRKHDTKNAGEWFHKAIEVDPNRETAYRYWGDALMQDGEKDEAKQKFIDAVVAEPYNRRSAVGLKQWAQHTGANLQPPKIQLPKGPEAKETVDGKSTINITVDEASLKKGKSGAAWMAYSLSRAAWQGERFKKEFPNETTYRHSLAEEVDALHLVLSVAKENKIKDRDQDENLRQLIALDNDNMIEPFVLLNAGDQGVVQDYPAYRAQHWAQLHNYIEKYIVHEPAK